MNQKGGIISRLLLLIAFVALVAVIFVLLGGGRWMRSAGLWMNTVGTKAEDVKQNIEQKAKTVEKTVGKTVDAVRPGDKK